MPVVVEQWLPHLDPLFEDTQSLNYLKASRGDRMEVCQVQEPAFKAYDGGCHTQACYKQARARSAADDASSWMSSSCNRAQPLRYCPYTTSSKYAACTTDGHAGTSGYVAAAACQEQFAGQASSSPMFCTQQPQQQVFLKHQPLDTLLEIAISLASRSLARTTEAFQAACHCWAFVADSDAAGQALERAEAAMARTMHRMQIVQQLAAAVLQREQEGLQAAQQQEQQRLLLLMQALQQQYLGAIQDDGAEEGEEEVCSAWRPTAAAAEAGPDL